MANWKHANTRVTHNIFVVFRFIMLMRSRRFLKEFPTNMKFVKIIIKGTVFLFLPACLLFISCKRDQDSNIPDVSHIDVDLDLTRFEQLVLADTNINAAGLQKIMSEHPAFSEVYFNNVMPKTEDIQINTDDPEVRYQNIISWIKHPATRWLYDTINQ